MTNENIRVTGAPQVGARRTVTTTMWLVVAALIPSLVLSVVFFGFRALGVVAVAMLAAVATEYAITRWMLRRPATVTDGSAALTGLLLGMSLPSSLPLWMVVAGSVFAIGVGKMAYGGLGSNIFNPAIVGRVFLLISFPAAMTTWPMPLAPDGVSGATVLQAMLEGGVEGQHYDLVKLVVGERGGSLGEIGAIALVAGGVFLLAKRVIKIYIPLSILLTMALLATITGNNVPVELLSGGVILGAIFMATDYVTSPMTAGGMVIYGVMIGVITFVIRHYGSYPEGISFAILIMNGCTPLINRWMQPRLFGERRKA